MPDVNPEDLLFLHHQIEKSQTEQQRLESVLSEKSNALRKNRATKTILKILSSFLALVVLLLLIYVLFVHKNASQTVTYESNQYPDFQSEIDALKTELHTLKEEQSKTNELKELYLFRRLIESDTVYSVQIQTFTDDKVAMVSEKFMNALMYSDTSYYKFSLGIFETLKEAQDFRKLLLESGVMDKHIFVISYKNGKRLKIEDPF